jgi:hypothetical protein
MADIKITVVDKDGVEKTSTEAPVAKVKANTLNLSPSDIEKLVRKKQLKDGG